MYAKLIRKGRLPVDKQGIYKIKLRDYLDFLERERKRIWFFMLAYIVLIAIVALIGIQISFSTDVY